MPNVIEEKNIDRLNKSDNATLSLMPSIVARPKTKVAIKSNIDNIPNFFLGLINPIKDGNVLYSIPNIIITGNNS
jgi:hypothetical protein